MITPEEMSGFRVIADSKNVLPTARRAIWVLAEEVERVHGTAVAQAEQIRALRERLDEPTP